ncbi:tetratricopeptide repeat protein [Caballeronia sp. LP006]|uniref:tetratricopeptide repeat protein n=1 Tax=Caballeronia sp. LP006 TaxID=3038552 RepID=UPI00286423C7|nr:tetratricopeptide repeat protein [Caballeronia sp. LP006]MDR5830031.1 tetratricopeptide repeat protein [Caballeronia sp. LP006]
MNTFEALDQTPAHVATNADQQFEADLADVLQAAILQHQTLNLHEAEKLYLLVLDARPQHADANFNLGMLMAQRGQYEAAVPFFETAIGTDPTQHIYWATYIDVLTRSGQVAAANIVFEVAVAQGMSGPAIEKLAAELRDATKSREGITAPNGRTTPTPQEVQQLHAHFNGGRLEEAVALAKTLTQRFPTFLLGWEVMGVAQVRLMDLQSAIPSLRRYLELKPDGIDVRRILADSLRLFDKFFEAEAECRRMIEQDPNYPEAHRILGVTLRSLMRLDDAQAACRRAVELAPLSAKAHETLGVVLMDQTRFDDAEKHSRRAIELDPTCDSAHENLLFCLSHKEEIDRKAYFEQHLYFAEQCAKPLQSTWKKHRNQPDPNRCIRVGFVSGDYNQHPVAVFIEPVFRYLVNDPSVRVHAYYNRSVTDEVTRTLRDIVPRWHDVSGCSDAALADKIRADGIDVLIDLSGHTAYNRLLTFARKPAPIQATWMGYLGTTGMTAMDYYIGDRHYVPEEQIDGQFVEKLAYLPAYAPFKPSEHAPALNALPALTNGHITFGSFNRFNKLRPRTIALWSELLRAVPHARMLIAGVPRDDSHTILIDWFEKEGIDVSRLEFRQRSSLVRYLAHHLDADIALDTFPYAGGVTTMQALWMGVPTLTLPGELIASRGSTSVLSNTGLGDFVARDRADFVAKGIEWAGRVEELAQIRAGMRERCLQSPGFQPDTVARALSASMRQMWQRWCAGKAAATFDV